jgi:hypothetical protein
VSTFFEIADWPRDIAKFDLGGRHSPRRVLWLTFWAIEMTRTPGKDYPMKAGSHPDEHALELPYSALIELQTAVHKMGETPERETHEDFIVFPTRPNN